MAKTIVDGRAVGIQLRIGDRLGSIANMLPINFPQQLHQVFLLLALGRTLGQMLVDEIVEAGQLPQAILAAKLVEAGDTALAIADQVERRDVDLLRLALQPPDLQVLQKAGMVLQREQPQALPAHAQRPIRQTRGLHRSGSLALERLDHGNLVLDLVGVT